MRGLLHGGLTLLAAFLAHIVFGKILAQPAFGVNPFLVAVLLFGVVKGDLAGAIMGSVAGLVADSFSLGVFGVSGAVYTAVGFLTGWISRRINVMTIVRFFVFLTTLSALAIVLRLGLTAAVIAERIPWSHGRLLLQPPATALGASLVFAVFRSVRRRYAR